MTVCERCRKGWQEGAGAQIVVEDAAVERALCNAQHIGSIDGAAPDRAYQDISPSVERFVWRRDGGRCRVDGCRSARGLEIHHIVHRADGGTHEPSNLSLLCSSCHAAHHRGALTITGTADQLVIHRPGQPASGARVPLAERNAMGARASAATPTLPPAPLVAEKNAHVGARASVATTALPPVGRTDHVGARASAATTTLPPASPVVGRNAHVGARASAATMTLPPASPVGVGRNAHVGVSKLDAAIIRTQAREALVGLGWKAAIAGPAVATAAAALGNEVTLERLIFESLRRCPMPKA
jgi:hypothetical protein